jgi:hypothetical protein
MDALLSKQGGKVDALELMCDRGCVQLEDGTDTKPWSATMARQILEAISDSQSDDVMAQHQQEPQQLQMNGTDSCDGESRLLAIRRHWAAALPISVPLPWVHCEDPFQTLSKLGDDAMALEAVAVHDLMVASQPEVQIIIFVKTAFFPPYVAFVHLTKSTEVQAGIPVATTCTSNKDEHVCQDVPTIMRVALVTTL